RLPLAVTAAQARTGRPEIDARLGGARITGDLALTARTVGADNLLLRARGAEARLVLRGDFARGEYALAGKARAQRVAVPGVGDVDAL
ncbi:hypothetical protein ABTM42_20425, partial [Acinetobacter baumannii]